MSKKSIAILLSALACIVIGISLFFITADQEFINLTPTDEISAIAPLDTGHVYEQEFTTYRKTIARFGAYMRPIKQIQDPASAVTFTLMRGDSILAVQALPAVFIEHGGPAYVKFSPPIETISGETLRMQFTVPEAIHRTLALRTRDIDGSFAENDTEFFIDGAKQPGPVAYNAFERIRPPLMKQLGGIFIMLGLFLIFRKTISAHKYVSIMLFLAGIALLYAIPAYDASMPYGSFAAGVFVLLGVSWWVFRITGNSMLGATLGAVMFACSTWLPLHILTGFSAQDILSIRDTLLDPNQIAVSHGAGAYIGFLGGSIALLGMGIYIVMMLTGNAKRYEFATGIAIIGIIGALIAFVPSALATGHAAIAVSFALAYFAALGISHLQRFLGNKDTVAMVLLIIFSAIAMLDLMHVAARTFTYGSGV